MKKINDKYSITKRVLQIVDEQAKGNLSEFARQVDIPISTFHHYMEGHFPKLIENLYNISKIYQVNLHWLLTGLGDPYASIADEDIVLEIKPENFERFIYDRLLNIKEIVELRGESKSRKLVTDFLVELQDNTMLLVMVGLGLNNADQLQSSDHLKMIFMLLGRQYSIAYVDMSELEALSKTPTEKELRDFVREYNKRHPDAPLLSNSIDALAQKGISHQDLRCLMRELLELVTTGKAQDILYLKGFVSNLVDKIRLESKMTVDK